MDFLNEDEIAVLREELGDHPLLERMIMGYELFANSPYLDSYLTMYNQVSDINSQLKIDPNDLNEYGDPINRISIRRSDEKTFERGHKYLLLLPELIEKMDKLRRMISPAKVEDVERQKKIDRIAKKSGK